MRYHHFLASGVLASLSSLAATQAVADSNCTVFNWNQQPGYLVNGTATRVSAASTCESRQNDTQYCPITAAGDQQETFTYQAAAPLRDAYWNSDRGSESFLHNLVLNTVNSSLGGARWPEVIVGSIDTTQALPPGTSGYINFTSFLRCFEGTMTNCTGDLTDNFTIQACAPVSQSTGAGIILAGSYSVVQVPQDSVDQYRNPFAGQSSGQTSGARGVRLNGSLLTAILILGLCGGLWLL